jgi:pyruvate/2-oxoglutarate dehydrogenase complex dihydrolipoamide acyltransferase (E2) component
MIREVFMPALSSTMTEGKIVSWSKSPGDKVEKGETVLIVESDKADMDVESFYEGYLAVIAVPAGEAAPVGSMIGYIAETEAEIPLAKEKIKGSAASASSAPTVAVTPAPVPVAPAVAAVSTFNGGGTNEMTATATSGRIIASPRARKLRGAVPLVGLSRRMLNWLQVKFPPQFPLKSLPHPLYPSVCLSFQQRRSQERLLLLTPFNKPSFVI